ncbi:thiamine phosphate synthase [Oceanobacillus damuensis]|uniref:thiamine phosphate synthase n=1 Tax=Oceanobacillus damuensis TaxID=937928 RepID=UPI00082FEF9F|nr:thiamine phosphate synthase [Oceanobacillus damuensis]
MNDFNSQGDTCGELHIISTGEQSPEMFVSIAAKLNEYVDAFHIREKSWSDYQLTQTIKLLHSNGIPLEKIIVNHHIDVANAMQVRGVQLTYQSIDVSVARKAYRSLHIGCSVHTVEEAVFAALHGADYLLYGHVFESRSKPGVKPKGLDGLKQVVQHVSIPVIAIGGITSQNTPQLINHGASGIAVLSGVLLSSDPVAKAISYRHALRKGAKNEETL